MKADSKAERLADDVFKNKYDQKQDEKQTRRLSYLLISWTLQLVCALLVLLLLVWGAVQFMRLWGILGVTSQEPPGLAYAVAL